jgi:putative phosphoesterase
LKIAFLSDIHSNYPALCRALEKGRKLGASRFIIAGDVVGAGPHPVEVIRHLKGQRIPAIRGNVDRKVLQAGSRRRELKEKLQDRKNGHLAWTAMQLGKAEREWLENLPPELVIASEAGEILVVHGSPQGDTDYIYPSITRAGLLSKLEGRNPAVLVCGHSHVPFSRSVAGVRILNCGSVGRPVDGDPRGTFGILEIGDGDNIRAKIIRFAYPVEHVAGDLESRRVPGAKPDEYRVGIKKKGA